MSDADLHRDIESTREALGDTVEALARKTDVKARVEAKVDQRKAQIRHAAGEVRDRAAHGAHQLQGPPGRGVVVALVAVVVVAGLVVRRRRR